MASAAFAGVGTIFKRGDGGSPETFTAIAEVNSITGPGLTADFIDVTSLDSTGGYKEYIRGFRDGGDVTLNMNFTLAGFNAMKDDYESPDAVNYQIILSDTGNTTIEFTGFVTDIPLSIQPDDKVTVDVTIKVTGQVDIST
jgi:predicted secreted protein